MARFVAILLLLLAVGACHVQPPRTGLVYRAADEAPGWQRQGAGCLSTRLAGVEIEADFRGRQARLLVTVTNATGRAVAVRMGARATAARGVIGEVLQRPLQPTAGAGAPDYVPYTSRQDVRVEAGWRAVFHLDSPLGREPSYGQFFVCDIEVGSAGAVERCALPVVVAHAAAGR